MNKSKTELSNHDMVYCLWFIKVKKTLLYKNIICLVCVSLCEWAALCRVLHTQVYALAPFIVCNSTCCLAEDNTESLADTERTINNPFIILFEEPLSNTLTRKAFHYYPSSSVICGSLDASNACYCPPQFTNTRQNKSLLFNSKKLTEMMTVIKCSLLLK